MDDYEPESVTESETCVFCNGSFVPDKDNQKYCSIQCGYRDKMCVKKICPECNELHYTEDKYNPYCSDECRITAKEKSKLERSCLECGSVFFARDKFDEFCTDECESSYDNSYS